MPSHTDQVSEGFKYTNMPTGIYKHKKLNKWSKKHDKCIVCGTDKRKHAGKGICNKCYFVGKYKEKNIENVKKWQKNNPEKVKAKNKRWRRENPGKIRDIQRKYRKDNFVKCKQYIQNKFYEDIHFKLRNYVSHRIRERLKRRLSSKKGKPTFSFLPYTVNDLKLHLEKQFKEGMSWKNYGIFGWHIDHIHPDCKFDYKSVKDEEFQKCWALENLQPLWAEENLRKGSK